jgi:group I intron endonuclease
MICIYQIENKITKDVYIGSSINFNIRKNQHINKLRRGKHHSIFLQAAFDKYEEANFEIKILEECSKCNIKDKEQFWIDLIKPLYNMCKKAYSTKGRKMTQETKEKLRKINLEKGTKPPDKTWKDKQRKVVQIELNTNKILNKFESLSEAVRSLGKPSYCSTNIGLVCKGKRQHIYGFKWEYLD